MCSKLKFKMGLMNESFSSEIFICVTTPKSLFRKKTKKLNKAEKKEPKNSLEFFLLVKTLGFLRTKFGW